MTRKLSFSKVFLSLIFGLIFLPQLSRASHYAGSDITYLCVAPNIYVFTAKIYRDCSGAFLNTSEILQIKSPACNTGRSMNMPLVPGNWFPQTNYYCTSASSQAICNSTATLPNIEAATYRATVTFSAAEQNCPDWYISLTLPGRPTIENLVNSTGSNLYVDAYLKLGSTINNNSPHFHGAFNALPFVCVNEDNFIAVNSEDPDGDSLSYHLSVPLIDYNVPVLYAQNTNQNNSGSLPFASQPISGTPYGACIVYNIFPGPNCPQFKSNIFDFNDPRPVQTAILPASFCAGGGPIGSVYSASNPLPVAGIGINWGNCATNFQAQTGGFQIDPLTGVIMFKPNVFHAGTQNIAGRNKYAVAVQVNEWRKINGVITKVGHVRRDFLIVVNNCGNLPTVTIQKQAGPPVGLSLGLDSVFSVFACSTTSFTIRQQDAITNDLLHVIFPDAVQTGSNFIFPNIPGLVMKPFTNNQNQVSVKFYITPTPSMVGKNYYLRHVVTDNGCPLKGRQEMVYRIQVNGNSRIVPVGNRDRTIAQGQSTAINVSLLRPDSMMVSNIFGPAAYNFSWTDTNLSGGLPNGLNPAYQNKKDIVVTPTQTTRYFLLNTSALSGCRDTTSVIVRIGSPTGLSPNLKTATGFTVFPNPFTDQLNFKINIANKADYQLVIYNLLGQKVDQINLKAMPAGEPIINWGNGSKLKAGNYLAWLVGAGGEFKTIRFTKL